MATLHGDRMLLLIDGDDARGRFIASLLARAGWRAQRVTDLNAAIGALAGHDGLTIDAVLADLAFLDAGLDRTVRAMRDWHPRLPILLHAGEAVSASEAMRALTIGVSDIVAAPFTTERLHRALADALAALSLPAGSDGAPLSLSLMPAPEIGGFSTASGPMRLAIVAAEKAARSDAAMVIEGEAGSGRAALAQAIHRARRGEHAPMVLFDCADHSEAMIAPLLFGHAQGAFAGAFERRGGRIADADGGTFVLRSAERLPADAQARLAEYLHSGWLRPVGDDPPQRCAARLIACTTTNLRALAARGVMREDVAARLSVIELGVPPLRERREDIVPLAEAFLAHLAETTGATPRRIAATTQAQLRAQAWPGNVRQLQAVIARAAARGQEDELTLGALPDADPVAAVPAIRPDHRPTVALYGADGHLRPLDAIEADVIRLAITHYRGRMSEVARRLGIGRSTLYRKLGDIGVHDAA